MSDLDNIIVNLIRDVALRVCLIMLRTRQQQLKNDILASSDLLASAPPTAPVDLAPWQILTCTALVALETPTAFVIPLARQTSVNKERAARKPPDSARPTTYASPAVRQVSIDTASSYRKHSASADTTALVALAPRKPSAYTVPATRQT